MWSTSLKPLVAWTQPGELDEQYVAGFLSRGGCPGRTPYRGIHSLPPGRYLTASRDGVRIHAFWRPPNGSSIRYSRELEYEDRLRELFRDAVRSRLQTDFPVISELSGGLDSSSIACMASGLIGSGKANARRFVTLSYEHEGSLDRPFYQSVAEWCGFANLRLLTTEHPFVSETHAGDTLPAFWDKLHRSVAAVARRTGARTLITGGLGDLVMGNWWDDSARVADLVRAGQFRAVLRETLAWSKALRIPVCEVLWKGLLAALPASVIMSRPELFIDNPDASGTIQDSLTPAFRERSGLAEGYDPFSRDWMKATPGRRKHVRALTEMLELRKLQPPEPLAHVYYTHPYAHRPLVEYMFSIPAEIVCRPGEPRRAMRRAFQHFWPRELRLRRSKDSFGGEFLNALRPLVPALAGHIEELQVVQRGYVDPAHLKGRLDRLSHSLECNAPQLQQIILLEAWLRTSRFSRS